jgi:hypothetical protein
MLYAEITLEQYPPGWEELEWKMRKLKQLDYSYSFQVGRQAFGYGMGPKYQFTLIRWGERLHMNASAPREVLYEGHDYYAVLGFVSMLLTAEEEKR